MNANIGPYIAIACLRCSPHTLGNHNSVMGVCTRCVKEGGPCQ